MPAMPDRLNAFLPDAQVIVANAGNGPLSGLTLAVKDIYDVAGLCSGWGNPQKLAEAAPAPKSASAVQRLLDAGARFVGKTQTDELAFSLMGQNAHYPEPVNSAAPDRVTGGSSSGSAAAVAGGLADIALGSDTGGSIRAPASFCGLIGLRTTHGAIPLDGVMALAPSFDTVGWFAKDITTYEKVAEVMLGADSPPLRHASRDTSPPLSEGEDGSQAGRPSSPPSGGEVSRQSRDGEGVRLITLPALDALVLPEATAEYIRISRIVADVLGAPSVAKPLAHSLDDLYWAFRKLQAYEAWAIHGPWLSEKDRGLGPGVKERFAYGATLGCEVATAETRTRAAVRTELADLLGSDGFLLMPTVPGAPPLKSASFNDIQAYRERALRLLCLSGLSGFPQITIPLGTTDGAPFGISLLGPAGSDKTLIGLAATVLDYR